MRNILIAAAVALAITIAIPVNKAGHAGDRLPIYHFCVPPYQKGQTIDSIRSMFQPMLTWLGEQIGCRFDVVAISRPGGQEKIEYIRDAFIAPEE